VIVVALVVVVGVVGAFFLKGAGGSGPAIGDKNTLPPQMKAAYAKTDGKPPTQASQR
jgi:hypothetical protein